MLTSARASCSRSSISCSRYCSLLISRSWISFAARFTSWRALLVSRWMLCGDALSFVNCPRTLWVCTSAARIHFPVSSGTLLPLLSYLGTGGFFACEYTACSADREVTGVTVEVQSCVWGLATLQVRLLCFDSQCCAWGQCLLQVWVHGHGLHQTSCGRLSRSHSRTRHNLHKMPLASRVPCCRALRYHTLSVHCVVFPLIFSFFSSWSTSLKSLRKNFFEKPETPCLGTWQRCQQDGHQTFCPEGWQKTVYAASTQCVWTW